MTNFIYITDFEGEKLVNMDQVLYVKDNGQRGKGK